MALHLLPHGFEDLMRGSRAEIGGEQRVLHFLEQFGIDLLFARDEVLDARDDLGARLGNRLLQAVEERSAFRRLFLFVVVAEKGEHKSFAAILRTTYSNQPNAAFEMPRLLDPSMRSESRFLDRLRLARSYGVLAVESG